MQIPLRDLNREQQMEAVRELVSAMRLANTVWYEVLKQEIVNPSEIDIRRCLFDKCIGHLPFVVEALFSHSKVPHPTERQKRYCLRLCREKGLDPKAVMGLFVENVGLSRADLSRIITILERTNT